MFMLLISVRNEIHKEGYTVQFNGDDGSILQIKRKQWLILLNYRISDLTLWEPLENSK